MKKFVALLAVPLALGLALTGCATANQDRSSGSGTQPDKYSDTSNVELFRNADNIPNVAYFCAGDFGWASTLSNDGTSAPQLVRFTEYDSICATEAR